VDAVGCCVGLRGIRIQNIVSELAGEKIDVINWNPDPAIFITHALSPAQVVAVKIDEKRQSAIAVIPDKQLSLAIGKEGQNVRLAVKLTGWRIDIKAASEMEKEKAEVEAAKAEAGKLMETKPVEMPPLEIPVAAALPATPALRFAEDILVPVVPIVTPDKDKKKKKKVGKEKAEDGIRLKKARRGENYLDQDSDEF
jgi:transcription termination/antitermination protein NusA